MSLNRHLNTYTEQFKPKKKKYYSDCSLLLNAMQMPVLNLEWGRTKWSKSCELKYEKTEIL